jgi:hypothetical protein
MIISIGCVNIPFDTKQKSIQLMNTSNQLIVNTYYSLYPGYFHRYHILDKTEITNISM